MYYMSISTKFDGKSLSLIQATSAFFCFFLSYIKISFKVHNEPIIPVAIAGVTLRVAQSRHRDLPLLGGEFVHSNGGELLPVF